MQERYRVAKVVMTANIEVLVNDTMDEYNQQQLMVNLAQDFVECLGDRSVELETVEFVD